MKVLVYGASDDLVEIEGDIREEFGCYNLDRGLLIFSSGTTLGVKYDDDGIWRFDEVRRGVDDRVTFFSSTSDEGQRELPVDLRGKFADLENVPSYSYLVLVETPDDLGAYVAFAKDVEIARFKP